MTPTQIAALEAEYLRRAAADETQGFALNASTWRLAAALLTAPADNLEGPGRTREEIAADARELDRIAPTPADKFALMFGRDAGGWRSIDSAPKSARAVLIHCSERHNTFVAENGSGKWRHFGGCGTVTETPTHWQPLPPPPISHEQPNQ